MIALEYERQKRVTLRKSASCIQKLSTLSPSCMK